MAEKESSPWAIRLFALGLLLPLLGFVTLGDYDSAMGLTANLMEKDSVVPFLWGQNPVACSRDSVQRVINSAFSFDTVPVSYACIKNTEIPFRSIAVFSAVLMLGAIGLFLSRQKIANPWPTEWKPFDEKNVRRKGQNQPLRLEDPTSHPISPKDGGF